MKGYDTRFGREPEELTTLGLSTLNKMLIFLVIAAVVLAFV